MTMAALTANGGQNNVSQVQLPKSLTWNKCRFPFLGITISSWTIPTGGLIFI